MGLPDHAGLLGPVSDSTRRPRRAGCAMGSVARQSDTVGVLLWLSDISQSLFGFKSQWQDP